MRCHDVDWKIGLSVVATFFIYTYVMEKPLRRTFDPLLQPEFDHLLNLSFIPVSFNSGYFLALSSPNEMPIFNYVTFTT